MTAVDNASTQGSFKDLFSGHSDAYAAYRPTYPQELFSFLADCCSRHELAWDCATGNGQAAHALAAHFERIVASDASEAQISEARRHPRISYRVAAAEASGLDIGSVDLITVAQALHWFDITGFQDEAQRVLAPGGVLAIWSYGRCSINPQIDVLINELYADIVGPYWLPERKLVEEGYRSVELPMPLITAPDFSMKIRWSADEMLGYLRTWSASQRYMKDRASDPVLRIEGGLREAWGSSSQEVSWPLNIKIGRV
jgi:SAM-dependent methyltransferase